MRVVVASLLPYLAPAFPRSSAPWALRTARTTRFIAAGARPAVPGINRQHVFKVPARFDEAVAQAHQSAMAAMAAGNKLLEIEFPSLPPMDASNPTTCSASDVFSANVRHATDTASWFTESKLSVAVVLPSSAWEEHAANVEGVAQVMVFPESGARGVVGPAPSADLYLVLASKCDEVAHAETLARREPDKTVVLFNANLDALRGDLGLPGYPGKSFHDRFLSRILPAYFIRPRAFTSAIDKPPFVVTYRGALARAFPGKWESLLDVGGGRCRSVGASDRRPVSAAANSALAYEAMRICRSGLIYF